MVSGEDVRSVDSHVRMMYNVVIRLRHSGKTCEMHIFLYIFRYIFLSDICCQVVCIGVHKLTGFIDAGGKYHDTEFFKACTSDNDCVFFLDEMDASIPEVLVLLNAAIANGYFEFPCGRVELGHVHFVAAGNTVGSGADEVYTGRMVLDQATLDRFAIIEFDYSIRIEMALSKGNSDLVSFIRQLREEATKSGIRATFSYRCIGMVTKLEKSGMDINMIIKIAVVKGLDKDTINTLQPVRQYQVSSGT